jgi:hypothetical protein
MEQWEELQAEWDRMRKDAKLIGSCEFNIPNRVLFIEEFCRSISQNSPVKYFIYKSGLIFRDTCAIVGAGIILYSAWALLHG